MQSARACLCCGNFGACCRIAFANFMCWSAFNLIEGVLKVKMGYFLVGLNLFVAGCLHINVLDRVERVFKSMLDYCLRYAVQITRCYTLDRIVDPATCRRTKSAASAGSRSS
jgi:hypothetical protein